MLIIAVPEDGAPRDADYRLDAAQRDAQQAHLQRLGTVERYWGIRFPDAATLAAEVWRSKLLDILVRAGLATKPIHLPYPSLGELFNGREAILDELRSSLMRIPETGATAIVGMALHGLGGVGKTRLAVEYAWRHAGDYTALLFVGADNPEALQHNLRPPDLGLVQFPVVGAQTH